MLKPPGAAARKLPPLKLAGREKAGKKVGEEEVISPNTRAAIKAAREAEAADFMAPTLRKSTMQRVEEAEKERAEAERLVCTFALYVSVPQNITGFDRSTETQNPARDSLGTYFPMLKADLLLD